MIAEIRDADVLLHSAKNYALNAAVNFCCKKHILETESCRTAASPLMFAKDMRTQVAQGESLL